MKPAGPNAEEWRQYLCRACGLIYDEEQGDPDSGLLAGTRFEDIPDDWMCPICGVTKSDFELYVAPRRVIVAAAPAAAKRGTGVVIVGAGLAGWGVASAIRALNAEVPITIVTACNGDVYNKPELSVALGRGMSPESVLRETGIAAAERLGVRLVMNTFAVGLSASRRVLRTTSGALPFTALVLAQGARPALLPGIPEEMCWRVNNLQAWTSLYRTLSAGPQTVAIIGAGMVGCELAEDLARAGHTVTLIGAARRPLEPLLPEPAGRRLETNLTALGIHYHGNTTVESLIRVGSNRLRLRTSARGTVELNHVISAIGLVTEPRIARSAGLAFERGIVVDPATLRTSAANIYALGDCASISGLPCRFIEPISRQAEVIAHGVLGRLHPGYTHSAPVIRLKTRSTPIVIHGAPSPTGEWRTLEDSSQHLRMEQWEKGELRARLAA